MGNAEAIPLAAGESVETKRRRSDELEQPDAGCELTRAPASSTVINTPHEQLFHQALIRASLSFETQSHPGGLRWEADIELHQAPIIIEVTNSPGEKRAADRRERKTADLEAAGYRVYWFSNHQARTSADRCVYRVMRECGLTPEASPVTLIRENRIGQTGRHGSNWSGGPQVAACEQCGTTVTAHRRNGGKTARFCNSQCYGKWMHEHPETVNGKRVQIDWTGLASLYDAGMSTYQLAEHYGCSRTAVKAAMRKNGIALRPTGGFRPKGGFYQGGGLPGS